MKTTNLLYTFFFKMRHVKNEGLKVFYCGLIHRFYILQWLWSRKVSLHSIWFVIINRYYSTD